MIAANDNAITFEAFPKIPRLNRGSYVMEKIDGTNACVIVTEDGQVGAQSRSRLITPEQDNFGFAAWVKAHEDELRALGPGRHFGEWWGLGIQRGYGLHERRFSLFNVSRWSDNPDRPACCGVVPVLYQGDFSSDGVNRIVAGLRVVGSRAVPGFMKPEGVVVYLSAARQYFKVMCENDNVAKGEAA